MGCGGRSRASVAGGKGIMGQGWHGAIVSWGKGCRVAGGRGFLGQGLHEAKDAGARDAVARTAVARTAGAGKGCGVKQGLRGQARAAGASKGCGGRG